MKRLKNRFFLWSVNTLGALVILLLSSLSSIYSYALSNPAKPQWLECFRGFPSGVRSIMKISRDHVIRLSQPQDERQVFHREYTSLYKETPSFKVQILVTDLPWEFNAWDYRGRDQRIETYDHQVLRDSSKSSDFYPVYQLEDSGENGRSVMVASQLAVVCPNVWIDAGEKISFQYDYRDRNNWPWTDSAMFKVEAAYPNEVLWSKMLASTHHSAQDARRSARGEVEMKIDSGRWVTLSWTVIDGQDLTDPANTEPSVDAYPGVIPQVEVPTMNNLYDLKWEESLYINSPILRIFPHQ